MDYLGAIIPHLRRNATWGSKQIAFVLYLVHKYLIDHYLTDKLNIDNSAIICVEGNNFKTLTYAEADILNVENREFLQRVDNIWNQSIIDPEMMSRIEARIRKHLEDN